VGCSVNEGGFSLNQISPPFFLKYDFHWKKCSEVESLIIVIDIEIVKKIERKY